MGHNRFGVSLRVIFCLVIITSLIAVGFGQVLCTDPISIGELRVVKSKKCVDISGSSGRGNVQTYPCIGRDDQQIILCGDGTIRNKQENYCFEEQSDGNVRSTACQFLGGIPERQRWKVGWRKTFTDNGGIVQVAKQLINVHSEKCLDVVGSNGEGNIGVYTCDRRDDQFFYIRSRGKELHFGRLRNEKSRQCLDVEGSNGQGDVSMYNCMDQADQWFRFYENGEIVNEKSRYCLSLSSTGSGNVVKRVCEDATDQMWSIPNEYCNDESCSFLNKRNQKCLDVAGTDGRGNVLTYSCQALPDQRFSWVTEKWTTPTATWNNVGCNQNGKVTRSISNSVASTKTVTNTVSLEISSTIEFETKFLSGSVSVTAATSLATAWSTSYQQSDSITFECENYDNGDDFTRGCMWQLQVDTTHVLSNKGLTWKPQIVKCTRSHSAPRCPPFTKCKNKDCTECQDL